MCVRKISAYVDVRRKQGMQGMQGIAVSAAIVKRMRASRTR